MMSKQQNLQSLDILGCNSANCMSDYSKDLGWFPNSENGNCPIGILLMEPSPHPYRPECPAEVADFCYFGIITIRYL